MGSDNGCSGGWPHTAYDSYISRNGYCSESSYSYTARGGSCRASSCDVQLPQGSVTGHQNVGKSSSSLKSALSQQPVSVTVNAGQLQLYANGVVSGSCSGQINHAVIAVGYGTACLLQYSPVTPTLSTGPSPTPSPSPTPTPTPG